MIGEAAILATDWDNGHLARCSNAKSATIIEKDVGHKTLACLFYVLRHTSFISIIAINEITCCPSPRANACNAAVGHTGIAPITPERPSGDEPSPRPARAGTSRSRAATARAQVDQSPSSDFPPHPLWQMGQTPSRPSRPPKTMRSPWIKATILSSILLNFSVTFSVYSLLFSVSFSVYSLGFSVYSPYFSATFSAT